MMCVTEMARGRSNSRGRAPSAAPAAGGRARAQPRPTSQSTEPRISQAKGIEDDAEAAIARDLEVFALVASRSLDLCRSYSAEVVDRVTTGHKHGSTAFLLVRGLSSLLDLLALAVFCLVLLAIIIAYGYCESDFIVHFIDTLDEDKGTAREMFVKLLDDLAETSVVVGLTALETLLVFFFLYVANSGQTFGMLLTGISYTRSGEDRQRPLSTLGTLVAVVSNILALPACPFAAFEKTGRTVGDMLAGVEVVRSIALVKPRNDVAMLLTPVKNKKHATEGGLARIVNLPLHKRKFNDVAFGAIFVVSTAGFYFAQKMFFASRPHSLFHIRTMLSGQWAKWLISSAFGNVDTFVVAHGQAALLLAMGSFVVFSGVLLVFRFFAKPLLLGGIALWLGMLGLVLYGAIMQGDGGQMLVWGAVLAVNAYLISLAWPRLNLTIEIWREAISTVVRHPLLALSVPCIEMGWQIYQCWLLSVLVCLWSEVGFFSPQQDEARMLIKWWYFQQLMVVFTLRAAFEIAIGGTVARSYFRPKDGSGDGFFASAERALASLACAFSTSFGSAVFGGLLLYIVEAVRSTHARVAILEALCPWVMLPVKLLLFLLRYALAITYMWFRNFTLSSLSYVGMYGVSFYEAAEGSIQLLDTSFSQSLMMGNWGIAMIIILANLGRLSVNYAAPKMLAICAQLLPQDKTLLNPSNLQAVYVISYYLVLSMLWSLTGATRAVFLCLINERSRGESCRAPKNLQLAMAKY